MWTNPRPMRRRFAGPPVRALSAAMMTAAHDGVGGGLGRHGPGGNRAVEHVEPFPPWYDAVALSYPGQAYAQHIMVLDRSAEGEALTRSALAVLLHAHARAGWANRAMSPASL